LFGNIHSTARLHPTSNAISGLQVGCNVEVRPSNSSNLRLTQLQTSAISLEYCNMCLEIFHVLSSRKELERLLELCLVNLLERRLLCIQQYLSFSTIPCIQLRVYPKVLRLCRCLNSYQLQQAYLEERVAKGIC